MENKIKSCPNCNGNNFYTMGEDTSEAVLVSAKKNSKGEYIHDYDKVLAVTPVICGDCDFISLFRSN